MFTVNRLTENLSVNRLANYNRTETENGGQNGGVIVVNYW